MSETAEQALDRLDAKRRNHEVETIVIDTLAALMAENGDIEAPNPLMPGAFWLYHPPADATREDALAWLRRHAAAVKAIAKALHYRQPIEKRSDDQFGVQFKPSPGTVVAALVPAALTCEMVETGETQVIPAVPERIEPVMEKRCPPSIFAGIEDEVAEQFEGEFA